ncbi:MAG: tRNA (adenosine(37)-N6)-threonylcarbamoyltransferase complex dimerization subunit type 1 TsaB [Desulfuromonadales bacterium]|nr:tRNA (adenosine(37)-N6)-threonylcarbamoyltransferase complex dimerization subunit type 1 TsaB [Desulfuromonadales bacterium]
MAVRLLTIQTAVPAASLALSEDRTLLAEFSLNGRRTHADWLLPALEGLLTRAGLQITDLDGFGVVIGPGSFTSLRVGLATVKGLAVATGLPLVPVSTLRTLAMQLPFASLPVCAMLDARKQEVYAGLYHWGPGGLQPVGGERVCKPEQLLAERQEPTLFVGDGALVYRSLLVRQLGARAHFAPDFLNLPRAAAAASLVFDAWQEGRVFAPADINPVYLRPSEAELNAGPKLPA